MQDYIHELHEHNSVPIKIIALSVEGLALLFQCFIGTVALRKIHSEKRGNVGMDGRVKFLFITTLISSYCATIISIIMDFMVMRSLTVPLICITIWTMSTHYFLFSLLCTLVLRLYITFNESVFRMTRCIRFSLIGIISFSAVCSIINAITVQILLNIIDRTGGTPQWILLLYSAALFCFVISYITGSAIAVFCFLWNLSKLSRMKDISDNQQRQLIGLSSRFLLLFVIAIAVTICAVALSWTIGLNTGLGFALSVPCICVNLVSLYLQFAFAQQHYVLCCGWLDRKCRSMYRTANLEMERLDSNSSGARSPRTPTSKSEEGT